MQISINSIDRLDFWPFSRLSSTQRHGDRLDRLDQLYTSLTLDLLHGTVFHTISIISVTLVFSSAASKLHYFVEHTSLVVSAPGRSVNSAIEMTVLLLLLFFVFAYRFLADRSNGGSYATVVLHPSPSVVIVVSELWINDAS